MGYQALLREVSQLGMFHGMVCLFISPDLDGYRAP